MIVGACQFNPVFGKVDRNLATAKNLIENVKADLVVLPELFASGYQFKNRDEAVDLAESAKGRTVQWALEISQSQNLILCGGFPERDGDRVFNSAFLTTPQGEIHTYRKIHLFFREKENFDPGDKGFKVWEINGVKIGVMVCFDWTFPESMRTLMLLGAEIVCHPSNLVLPYCQDAMKTRCLENGVFAITANRFGTESRIQDESLCFSGKSCITGPLGDVPADTGKTFTGVLTAKIDIAKARDKNLNPFNNRVADRRPEFYEPVCRRRK